MNVSRFFIDRPILAIVLSLLMVFAGALSFRLLPLSEYPLVTPPTVQVSAFYPAANPQVIAETVASPIEQAIMGVEGMIYMSSQAATDGRMTTTVTFDHGIDPEVAQVRVQNRVALSIPRLPPEVQRIGVVTKKTSPDILMVVNLVSPQRSHDALALTNYAILNIRDALARLDGVGDVVVWGAGEYAMRIWTDPAKLAALGLTAGDLAAALRDQNIEAAAGSLGQSPGATAAFQVALETTGRLKTVEEFNAVVVRTGEGGSRVTLGDVAKVELGADNYSLRGSLNGAPAAAIQIFQAPGANALDVAAEVKTTMQRLSDGFPSDTEYGIAYDPTIFVEASLHSVWETLIEAVLLVVLVVILFLQTWRSFIIPLAAVVVSLVGTFAVLLLLGFSLNTLSLFGLVLSIGIVVDDAIVVVENVERHIELKKSPLEASHAAMAEVSGPIIAITSVLAAIFVPTAFLPGLQGEFYRQFAVTIAVSTILSAINSLTLSPALAALLLKPRDTRPDLVQRLIDRLLGWFFRLFNRAFNFASLGYAGLARRAVRLTALVGLGYLGLVGTTGYGLMITPTGFIPAQDKYFLVGIAQLPAGSSLERTDAVVAQMTEIILSEPGVSDVAAFPGLSINGFANLPNAAVLFAMLDPFEDRQSPDMRADAIAGRLWGKLGVIQDSFVGVFPPPPVPGLGATGGFKLQILDRENQGFAALSDAAGAVMAAAAQRPELAGLMGSFDINAPQIEVVVDREKALAMGIPLSAVFETLQGNLGSLYVNDFNSFGRNYKVMIQVDAPSRQTEDAFDQLYLRKPDGIAVPLSALVRLEYTSGPDRVVHYNGFNAADISGGPAAGYSSNQATTAMEAVLASALPAGFAYEWTDLAYQEKEAGSAGAYVLPLSIVLAFLFLAALYNSWSLPFAVLLIAPLAITGALVAVWFSGGDNNIFTQIGFIVLIGLAAKNAILIVEFARSREQDRIDPVEAVVEAAGLRLRPILMTSVAFIAGVVPLVMANGAGSEMRQAMGYAVFGGMIGVTMLGLILTPVFYGFIRGKSASRSHLRV
mgnify:CR=1 FL=1|tara:strand:- start:7557 stop:10700 length:3144 start_codon:yes stop_codon:yes gene_type:complete